MKLGIGILIGLVIGYLIADYMAFKQAKNANLQKRGGLFEFGQPKAGLQK